MSGRGGHTGGHTALHRRNIFMRVLVEYMMQTTLHGYRYLAEPGRHWIERAVWGLVHISTTTCVFIIVYGMYDQYITQRPVTTVASVHFPIQQVPFPAVAICDVNKLRKSRTFELAAQLYNEYNVSVSEERLGVLLRNLGLLYDQTEQSDLSGVKELDKILNHANITLDIHHIMKKLTTPCEELIVDCKWESRHQECAEIFAFRKTMEGYCCTFNYIRPSDDFQVESKVLNQSKTSPTAGPHMGLTVLVQTNLSDYYYPLIPIVGLKVLIYNPTDYPDTGSGGLTELLVPTKQEVFFSLSAITTNATQAVKQLDGERRNCYFPGDQSSKFGEMYSYSDCLMDCRIESIRRLCGCLPFFSPMRETTRTCGLADVPCLHQYRDSWQTMKPKSNKLDKSDTSELGGVPTLSCDICVAACTTTLYIAQVSSMPLSQTLIDNSKSYSQVDVETHSVVHIYFGSSSTSLMKTDVLTTWFELLSNIGGICGVFVGFSLMSVVEFLYFFTVRLAFELWNNRGRRSTLPDLQPPSLPPRDLVAADRDQDVAGVHNPASRGSRGMAWGDVYPKRRVVPLENQADLPTGSFWESPQVNLFWNEMPRPKNPKRKRTLENLQL